ncbi:MAG TPA: NADP-dependent isocitrate dehydrogenase [Azospirillaceae bacterium]|nr:NADP-dependent isocitrate dehydrogenase [Azospirillaceae bacterium]
MSNTPITVARGDGIGPEIMDAVLFILKEAGARLDIEEIEIGEAVYKRGINAGIEPSAWDSLRRTKVFLKSPITTPQGGGFKSLNVAVRTTMGLFANVRPCVSYHPFVATKHPKMDVVIVRENEEDLYAGIEHRATADVCQSIKLITRPGCERIVRYAFEYARANHRQKVTAFVKDNIMKISDGLFHRVFDEVAAEYPDIKADSMIVDIGAARLADTPDIFDVIVTLNLYGDIISDIAAQITGSVGLAGSSNIGDQVAMFEAIHGSAPTIAGQGIANPSGLLLGAVMMLVHVGQPDVAEKVHNAWLKTIEDGVHTADVFNRSVSRYRVGTRQFAEAVVERMGQKPETFAPVTYAVVEKSDGPAIKVSAPKPTKKELIGVDVFLDWKPGRTEDLAAMLLPLAGAGLELQMISNRGSKVWPNGAPETLCTDHWRARYIAKGKDIIVHGEIVELLGRMVGAGLDFVHTESLYKFDGKPGFSVAGGQ